MLLYGTSEYCQVHLYLSASLRGFPLALRINGSSFEIPETEDDIVRRGLHPSPEIYLAMRFTPGSIHPSLCEGKIEKSIEKQEMFFIPLGNILMENSKSQDKLANEHWIDTNFILVLQTQKDGTTGDLYMVCNMTWKDRLEEEYYVIDTDMLKPESAYLKLCSDSPSFTLAKVKRGSRSLFSSFFRLPFWSDSPANFKELELEIVSVSMLDIVQTGHEIDKEHKITLYGVYSPEGSDAGDDSDVGDDSNVGDDDDDDADSGNWRI